MKLKGSVLIVFLMFCDIGFSQVKLIAHRGAKKYAPENTIPAFLKAKELGADFVEIDVRQTKDGILVAMHDATVDRTTNGTGAVKNLTWSEVQKLDATAEWKDEYSNIPVPSFRQVVQKTKGIINLDIDFKDGNLDSVIAILKQEQIIGQYEVLLHTSKPEFIRKVQKEAPQIDVRTGTKKHWKDLSDLKDSGVDIISFYAYRNKKLRIRQIKNEGLKAFVDIIHFSQIWGVKSKVRKSIKHGAAYIQTDKLPKVKKYIDFYSQ